MWVWEANCRGMIGLFLFVIVAASHQACSQADQVSFTFLLGYSSKLESASDCHHFFLQESFPPSPASKEHISSVKDGPGGGSTEEMGSGESPGSKPGNNISSRFSDQEIWPMMIWGRESVWTNRKRKKNLALPPVPKPEKVSFAAHSTEESEDLTMCSQGSSSTDQEPIHRPHRPLPFCHLCRTPPDPAGQWDKDKNQKTSMIVISQHFSSAKMCCFEQFTKLTQLRFWVYSHFHCFLSCFKYTSHAKWWYCFKTIQFYIMIIYQHYAQMTVLLCIDVQIYLVASW